MSTFNFEEKNLMLIQAMDYFSAGLAGIFVTVYFFNNSDIKTTMLFNIVMYSALLFFYIASGWSLKRVSSAFLIRIGLLSAAIFYFLLFVLREESIKYVIPLGILSGFGNGNYWVGLNLNQYIFTNKEKRVEYFGSTVAITNVLSAAAPLIGGAIILLTKSHSFFGFEAGYSLLFFIVFLIVGFMTIFVGKLPSHEIPNFSYRQIISHKRSKIWKLILWQQVVKGLYDSSMGVVIGILFFLIVKNEFALGTTQTIVYFLGTIGSLISIRLLNKNNVYFWVGCLGLTLGIGLFASLQNWYGVIFFVIIAGFCSPFLDNWMSTVYFKTMDEIDSSWKEKYHLMLERDIALGISRIISFIFLFIFLEFGDQVLLARTWLYFLPFLPLFLGLLLSRMKTVPGN